MTSGSAGFWHVQREGSKMMVMLSLAEAWQFAGATSLREACLAIDNITDPQKAPASLRQASLKSTSLYKYNWTLILVVV